MLAADKIIVAIGGSSVELRPSLRAALRIARRHNGFAAPLRAVLDGNVLLMASLIEDGADTDTDIPDLLDEIGLHGLGATLPQLTAPLSQFVLALAGHDDNAKPAVPKGKPVPFTEHFERLFKIATGALGWSPEVAWSATPDEIIAAYSGRQDLLAQIFGVADTDAPDSAVTNTEGLDPEFDRAGLERLRQMARGAN